MGVCCSSREKIPARGIVTTSDLTRAKVDKIEQESKDMEKYVLKVINEGKPWTDKDFPPELSSLYDPKIDKTADGKLF